MFILQVTHFGTYRNFKRDYICCIREYMKQDFLIAVSYFYFTETEQCVCCKLVFFFKHFAFGKCSGMSCGDSSMVSVCYNLRCYDNKVFKGIVIEGKSTMK